MVKKIDKPTNKKPSEINSSQSIKTAEVASAADVKQTKESSNQTKVRSKNVSLTEAERQLLFKIVNEEAEKMLSQQSGRQKKIAAEAVKMAIDSGIVEPE